MSGVGIRNWERNEGNLSPDFVQTDTPKKFHRFDVQDNESERRSRQ